MDYTQRTSTRTVKQQDGYPALADFIAQDPDHETFVFRRFKSPSARNILNRQGELIKLEDDIAALEREAADSLDPELHLSMRSWAVFNENSCRIGRDWERKQKVLAGARSGGEAEEVLSVLSTCEVRSNAQPRDDSSDEALMLQRDIAMLESPSPRVVSALRERLRGPPRTPNDSSKLDDSDREMFTIAVDLVALRPPPDQDLLSRLLRDHWPFPAEAIRYIPFE